MNSFLHELLPNHICATFYGKNEPYHTRYGDIPCYTYSLKNNEFHVSYEPHQFEQSFPFQKFFMGKQNPKKIINISETPQKLKIYVNRYPGSSILLLLQITRSSDTINHYNINYNYLFCNNKLYKFISPEEIHCFTSIVTSYRTYNIGVSASRLYFFHDYSYVDYHEMNRICPEWLDLNVNSMAFIEYFDTQIPRHLKKPLENMSIIHKIIHQY